MLSNISPHHNGVTFYKIWWIWCPLFFNKRTTKSRNLRNFFFQTVSLLCLLISTSQLRWREGLKSWRYPRLKCVEINGNTPERRTVFILVAISWKDIFSDCLSAYWIFHFPILKRPHFTDKIREYQIEFFTWFSYSLVIFEIFTKQGFERRKRLLGIYARTEFHVK